MFKGFYFRFQLLYVAIVGVCARGTLMKRKSLLSGKKMGLGMCDNHFTKSLLHSRGFPRQFWSVLSLRYIHLCEPPLFRVQVRGKWYANVTFS